MGQIGPEILGQLFDEHAAALTLYARQWCDAPEDIVQDAFVALARQTSEPDRAVAWLYRVVRNGAIDGGATIASTSATRRAGRRSRGRDPWPLVRCRGCRIDAERAARLLADLDLETREIIVARVWGGLTFEEVARLQGCSLTTAHRRYQAGLARLHERLESPWTSIATNTNTT